MPGQAIQMFLELQMGHSDDEKNQLWRDFPRILVKGMTANTYFFTRLIEMSQKK